MTSHETMQFYLQCADYKHTFYNHMIYIFLHHQCHTINSYTDSSAYISARWMRSISYDKWWHNDSNISLARPLYSDGEDSQGSWIQLVTSSRLRACALQLLSRLSIFLVIYDVAHCVLSKSRLPRKAEFKKKVKRRSYQNTENLKPNISV